MGRVQRAEQKEESSFSLTSAWLENDIQQLSAFIIKLVLVSMMNCSLTVWKEYFNSTFVVFLVIPFKLTL